MKKALMITLTVLFIVSKANSQYADLGTGSLKNHIWWFDWSGFTIANGATRTFNTADGLNVTVTFTNVQGPVFSPTAMNTWYGSVLHFLYDFSDAAVRPSFYSPYTTQNSSFNINVTATRNGLPVPFKFIAADAEASAVNEITTLTTSGSNWLCVDFFRNSTQNTNPFAGCNTSIAALSDTWGGGFTGLGQNPVISTDAPATGLLSVSCDFNRNGVDGQMGVAFGIFSPIDRGDLPASYGYAQHRLNFINNNACNYLPPLPSLTQSQNLKLGALPGDADASQTLNDNAIGADEDGVTVLPMYNNSGTHSITVSHTNTTGSTAYLTAWLDYNKDGVFTINESVTVNVSNNAVSSVITWTGIPVNLPVGTANGLAIRLRLSSNLSQVQSPSGYAADGEVEDYFIPINCAVLTADAGTDLTICSNASFSLNVNAVGATSFAWTPRQFLNDSTLQSPTGTVTSTTKFYVTVQNGLGCQTRDSVTVFLNAAALFSINAPKTICNASQIQLNAGGGTEYLWSPANFVNNATISNPSTTNLNTSQLFSVKIKNSTCNDSTVLTTLITVAQPLNISAAKSNDIDCSSGNNAQLTATGAAASANYVWSPATGLNNPASQNPIATPATTTTYYVTATDINGCTSTDSIMVNVSKTNTGNYSVPNVFTPNNDGVNDCFKLKYWGKIEELDLSIYNRYGERVFYTNDPAKCWNGLYKTDTPLPGNYVYHVKAKTACGYVEKRGNLLLLK